MFVNNTLKNYIGKLLREFKVHGYVKPLSSFYTLDEWHDFVNEILECQKLGVDTRGGDLPNELKKTIFKYFKFQLIDQVERWDLLTRKNVLDFIEDFVNHRYWGITPEYSQYFEDISRLKFAYFYSRGDIEPYVLIDDEFTMQLYGTINNPKRLMHYTTEAGLVNLRKSIKTGHKFDISAYTVTHRPFFKASSNIVVTFIGNVKAGFRSDIKSIAIDNGERACNMHRLQYPGHDIDNICRDLDTCDGNVRTSLWNEYIATPIEILSIEHI